MASYNWKVMPDPSARNVEHVPFLDCRKFFAADNSGSTVKAISRSQQTFVNHLRNKPFANNEDAISLRGSKCSVPTKDFDSVRWTCNEGTDPSVILKHPAAVDEMQVSDAWYLLTGGEILDRNVHQLAELALELNVLNVPAVFLIVGSRGCAPETINISVGFLQAYYSFFISAFCAWCESDYATILHCIAFSRVSEYLSKNAAETALKKPPDTYVPI